MIPGRWRLQFLKLEDGERLPVLLSDAGVPHFDATLFVTTQVRGASAQPNTIYAVLTAIRILLAWLDVRQIDLATRVRDGRFLNSSELDSLSNFVASRKTEIDALGSSAVATRPSRNRTEGARAAPSKPLKAVTAATKYSRLTYIANFLEWYALREASLNSALDVRSSEKIKQLTTGIRARRPRKGARITSNARQGLEDAAQRELFEISEVDSPNNPFRPIVRARNYLIVRLVFDLAIRAGELLSLKVADFDFVTNEVVIARRHDDIDDPRPQQPVVKTRDRRLPLSQDLADAVLRYVSIHRRKVASARLHPFLFVVHQPGKHLGNPLSSKGLGKVFSTMKHSSPALSELCCHALRHTANDRFSELMDDENVPAPREEKLRSYAMGWKEGSGTASIYTRRHTARKAKEAALKLQGFKHPGRKRD